MKQKLKTMKCLLSLTLALLMLCSVLPAGGVLQVTADASTKDKKITDCYRLQVIEYGSYPQSEVTDISVKKELLKLAGDTSTWTSYGYYTGNNKMDGTMVPDDYMVYTDVEYNKTKYRGVYFTKYRMQETYYTANTEGYSGEENKWPSVQSLNEYYVNNIYWFKYEPIEWKVLNPETGLVISRGVLDAQPFNNYINRFDDSDFIHYGYCGNAEKTHYASDYANSSIRQWLINDFFNTAFSDAQQAKIQTTELDNSAYYYMTDSEVQYWASQGQVITDLRKTRPQNNSTTTNDKIFLLSADEVVNENYGFDADPNKNDTNRKVNSIPSEYAQVQGSEVIGRWWLRTAQYDDTIGIVDESGKLYSQSANYTAMGVRPAFRFDTTVSIKDDENCDCACHDDLIRGLLFQIKILFCMLFGIESQRVCKCGAMHW